MDNDRRPVQKEFSSERSQQFRTLDDDHVWSKLEPEVEFQYGGRLFFQTVNSYISAADWDIPTKFGFADRDWHSEEWVGTQSETGSKSAP